MTISQLSFAQRRSSCRDEELETSGAAVFNFMLLSYSFIIPFLAKRSASHSRAILFVCSQNHFFLLRLLYSSIFAVVFASSCLTFFKSSFAFSAAR